MDNEKEVIIDPNNEEKVEETVEETEETTEPKEEKEEKFSETPEAKKARLERQLNQLGKKHPDLFKKETTKPSKKSDELDYGEKAFLTSNGIKGSKEFDFVKDELKKSGEDLDSLLENEYFQARLEKFRALNKTADAIPKGKGGSGVPTDSVEYWMTKPIEEVPQEMRIKVVNAKLKQDESKGKFYNQK